MLENETSDAARAAEDNTDTTGTSGTHGIAGGSGTGEAGHGEAVSGLSGGEGTGSRRRAASRPAGPPPEIDDLPPAPPVDRPTARQEQLPGTGAPVSDVAAAGAPTAEDFEAEDVEEDVEAEDVEEASENGARPAETQVAETPATATRRARSAPPTVPGWGTGFAGVTGSGAVPGTAPGPVPMAVPPVTTPITPESAGSDDSLTVPAVTFQPPMVVFQPPEPVSRPASKPAGRAAAVAGSEAGENEPAQPDEAEASAQADEGDEGEGGDRPSRRRRRRGGRGRGKARDAQAGEDEDTDDEAEPSAGAKAERAARQDRRDRADKTDNTDKVEAEKSEKQDRAGESDDEGEGDETTAGTRRRRRRRRRSTDTDGDEPAPDVPNTVVHVREARVVADEVQSVRGSTRLEAKKQRRREGREQGRRRPPIITESEFLARRESVERVMVVRRRGERTQIAVLEDGVLVEHYVDRASHQSYVGNVYLGKVQNVLPSMEAAFVDIGKGRNAVLYAGEVNWDVAGLEGHPRRIESALKSGQSVMVQVTKDPLGHKGARLTSQVSLPGRYLVYVPDGSMTGISRKLPDKERSRLKQILKKVMPENAGVIVRTAAEGATEEELTLDINRLSEQWADIQRKAKTAAAPSLLHGEPDLTIRVVRDVFNEDFSKLVVAGDEAWDMVQEYVRHVAPHLAERAEFWETDDDVLAAYRVDEQIAKALERKVWLPSGGSLVIDRTEAMTVVDVNTGKFTGQGGNLEETVTRNNLEAAEEIVRQLRLRDIGGIIVIDFIDMVLENNRDLVLRRLLECLSRDRTKHQVAEVTSLGLVQMTRKRVGQGLLEAFSEICECCNGRGIHIQTTPVDHTPDKDGGAPGRRRKRKGEIEKAVEEKISRHENGKPGSGKGRSGGGRRQSGGRTDEQAEQAEQAKPASEHGAGEHGAGETAAVKQSIAAVAEAAAAAEARVSGGETAARPEAPVTDDQGPEGPVGPASRNGVVSAAGGEQGGAEQGGAEADGTGAGWEPGTGLAAEPGATLDRDDAVDVAGVADVAGVIGVPDGGDEGDGGGAPVAEEEGGPGVDDAAVGGTTRRRRQRRPRAKAEAAADE